MPQERLAACGLPFLQAALHFLTEKLSNSAILTSADGPAQVLLDCTFLTHGPPVHTSRCWTSSSIAAIVRLEAALLSRSVTATMLAFS